jgi:endonuclease/exonuclease/phosphatase family metal-dependent hydrolase
MSGDLAVEVVIVPDDDFVRNASDHLPFFVQLGLPDINEMSGGRTIPKQ